MKIDLMPLAYVAFWFCVAFGVHSCSKISMEELKYTHLEESCNEH